MELTNAKKKTHNFKNMASRNYFRTWSLRKLATQASFPKNAAN